MSGQTRIAKPGNVRENTPVPQDSKQADTANTDKLKEDMDSLLDEIDGVLEENAEEFVNSYVQKGGE